MTLKARLTEDMKTAMRAKDSISLSTIRLVIAAVKQFEIDERVDADDAKVISIITKMVKQRKDSAQIYTDASRQDLADKENTEIEILDLYLPIMMNNAQIEAEVAAAINQTGAVGMGDMGKVMGVLKTKLSGKADMGKVSALIKVRLS